MDPRRCVFSLFVLIYYMLGKRTCQAEIRRLHGKVIETIGQMGAPFRKLREGSHTGLGRQSSQ